MANNMILRLIQQECKEKKITQKKLCHGICDRAYLSRSMKDEIEMDKLMLEVFMQRLGISTRRYMFILRDSEYSYFELREQIRTCLWNNDLTMAEELVQEYLDKVAGMKSAPHLHRQVALLLRSYVMSCKKESWEAQMENVIEALACTKVSLEELDFQEYAYGEIELLLILRGAMLFQQKRRTRAAKALYRGLYDIQKQSPYNSDEFAHIFAKVNYQMAKYYLQEKNYEKVLEVTEHGIEMLAEGNKILYMWELMEMYLAAEENLVKDEEWTPNHEVFINYEAMKNVVAEHYKNWNADTHCPMYYERKIYSLKKMSAQRRRLHGETQASISKKNYCNKETISRLEQGRNDPQSEIRYQLLDKIGLPPEKCYHMLVADNISARRNFFKVIDETDKGNLEEAKKLLEDVKASIDLSININKQAIALREFGIEQKEKRWSVEEQRERLLELLSYTLPLEYLNSNEGGLLYGNEKNLIRRVILNYTKSGQMEKAIDLTNKVLDGYKAPKVVGDEFIGLYLSFSDLLENMYANTGLFEVSDEIIEESLQKCIQHDFAGWLEFLLYDAVWNREKQGLNIRKEDMIFLDVAIMIAAIKNHPDRKEFISRYKNNLCIEYV